MTTTEQQSLFFRRRSRRGTWLAMPAALLANLLLFYVLAAARTTPVAPRVEDKRAVPIAMAPMPIPKVAEPEIARPEPDVVASVNVASVEASALPETTALLMPRLAGLDTLSTDLPGLPVALPRGADLRAVPMAQVSKIEQPFSLSQVDRAPRRIAGALPRVPQWARRAGLEGAAWLRFVVTADGGISDINITRIDGDERFGPDAKRTAMTWRFEPAMKAGRPVAMWCFQKVDYTLED